MLFRSNFRTEVDQTNPSLRFGIGIPLPFWNQREGPIAEAQAGRKQVDSIARARENLRALLTEACPEFSSDAEPGDWFEPARNGAGRLALAVA